MTTRHTALALLRTRRFLPLLLTQALGALNDNIFKAALSILILYRLAEQSGSLLVTVASGLFIAPFFLFSATAGQLADRFEKAGLIRLIKAAEIGIMAAGTYGLLAGSVPVLLAVLFAMGTQSAFFGPLKYSILPAHLAEDELVAGNSLVETTTFLTILLGTMFGSLVILRDQGAVIASVAVIAVAVAGYLAARAIPAAPAADPGLRIDWNIVRETRAIIRHASSRRSVFLSILGISWFWTIGAVFLSQFPALAKDVLGGDETVVTLLLAIFSIGIGLGSLACNRLLKGEISARHVPLAAIAITLFALDLHVATQGRSADGILGLGAFLAQPANIRPLVDLFAIAVAGGLFIVPLYAILQAFSDASHRSRTIAANNILNALFMVVGTGVAAVLLALGAGVSGIFLALAATNALVALYSCLLLPTEMLKGFLRLVFRLAYRVEVKGLENVAQAGERAVIVINHQSFLDAPLVAAFLPGRPSFAMNTFIARKWWVKPALAIADVVTIDPTNPMATKHLVKAAREGRKIVIFPEGRITTTGALMKVYAGPGMIADKADAAVLPVRIEGALFTPFSRMAGKFRRRWFPRITITVLPPRRIAVPAELRGRKRREAIGTWLQDLMSEVAFATRERERTLFEVLLDTRRAHGGKAIILEDIERKPVDYDRLVMASFALGSRIASRTAPGEAVGVLVPNALGAVVTFFGLHAYGRVPAMLNFTAGAEGLVSACATGAVRTVLTSRRFVATARLERVVEALAERVRIVYLEDLKAEIGPGTKLRAALAARLPDLFRDKRRRAADPAVILYTSGSEGQPKGVALSHANILANCAQVASRVDFNPTDVVFNALPMFHSFGLTGGTLLPVLGGVPVFLYPSPLHFRIVPELVYDCNATILFGTDTFLSGYARMAHPYDFYSVRYVFAGAEKVREETRRTFMDKFGLRLFEGYGATECAPVIAVNTPMHFRAGTVGRLLPGIDFRLEPVPGVPEGGRLFVRGPNVMAGYYRHEAPGVLEPPPEGWYDTGDIVSIDADGYVRILGRAKRFAKIGGEMISLTAVEGHVSALWPDHAHAVLAVRDPRRGEQLVLLTTNGQADRDALLAHARARGVPELMIPKAILRVPAIPLLGTGKTDYPAAQRLAESAMKPAEEAAI